MRKLLGLAVLMALAVLGLPGVATAAVPRCGTMLPGESLAPGEELLSCSGRYRLVHQTDGNVVVYDGTAALWSSNTAPRATTSLAFQVEGNVVLYAGAETPWVLPTDGRNKGVAFAMQDDGNLVVYGENGQAKWGIVNGGLIGTWVHERGGPIHTGCTTQTYQSSPTLDVGWQGHCTTHRVRPSDNVWHGQQYVLWPKTSTFVPN